MAHSDELFHKAHQLNALANDVEVCCDKANTASQGSKWHCDNASEVREAIRGFRKSAQTAAENIRDEAARVKRKANAALEDEREKKKATPGHPVPSAY